MRIETSAQPLNAMESYAPNSDDMMKQNSSHIPTAMEGDIRADEDIIDQTKPTLSSEETKLEPAPIEKPLADKEPSADDLASSIAYALDGSGRGDIHLNPANKGAELSEHKVITEGTTGAGLADEEANLSNR